MGVRIAFLRVYGVRLVLVSGRDHHVPHMKRVARGAWYHVTCNVISHDAAERV